MANGQIDPMAVGLMADTVSDPLGKIGRAQRKELDTLQQPIWSEDYPEMKASASTCGPRSLAALAVGLKLGKDAFLAL